jgi:hypothetical protein
VGILLKVNGSDSGSDWLYASVAGRRFPARVSVTNTGPQPAEVELRMRPDSGAEVRIGDPRLRIEPGATAETSIQAETTSTTYDDTVLQALVGGAVEAEFRFTVVSLLRESYFHALVPKRGT